MKTASTLDQCENMYGKLNHDLQGRIRAFLTNPTPDTWDDITGIIIEPSVSGKTIWQAVCAADSNFPHHGRSWDVDGNTIDEWEQIPTPFQVLQAIRSTVVGGR